MEDHDGAPAHGDRGAPDTATQSHPQTGPTWSPRRIGRLTRALAATTHLEVGVFTGETFHSVIVPYRTGVDPDFRVDVDEVRDELTTVVGTTSDEFFAALEPEQMFAVMFLDGNHTHEQTYRGICNATRYCTRTREPRS